MYRIKVPNLHSFSIQLKYPSHREKQFVRNVCVYVHLLNYFKFFSYKAFILMQFIILFPYFISSNHFCVYIQFVNFQAFKYHT